MIERPLKIAILSFEYPPDTGLGGIGTYTWYQARALAKLGHEVHVLAGALNPKQNKTFTHDGVRVYRFKAHDPMTVFFKLAKKARLFWTHNRLENAYSMYLGLKNLLQEQRYDLIEMPECGAEGLFINHFLEEKTIIKFHSPAQLIMPFYDVSWSDHSFCSFLEQIAIKRGKYYSTCSFFLKDEVRSKLKIKEPVKVIPNGIDLSLFDQIVPEDFRKKLNLPQDNLIVFFAGRIEKRKGIHLFLKIVASILASYEVSFLVAGQDLFKYMSKMMQPFISSHKLKGSFHYLGHLDQDDFRSVLHQADIFLIPSLWENCPYTCLEAMAASRAIISSDVGGMPELIQHEKNGLLAQMDRPDSFIKSIERLINDKALRLRLGKAARKTIENRFTDVYIAQLSVDYYKQCI